MRVIFDPALETRTYAPHDCPARMARRAASPMAEEGGTHAGVVFSSRTGTALEERNVRHVFDRMVTKAGLRHIRIHDLRHTFASLLLQQGESVVYVKEQLGHGSIQITVDTYGHLIPGANRGAVDRLDDDPRTQPSATQAQPEPSAVEGETLESDDLLGESGEPRWNRTINPQIKSLLLCQLS
jgi:hypothetical protein